jgi:hypothetical protein
VFLSLDGKGEIKGTDGIETCCKGIDGVILLDDNRICSIVRSLAVVAGFVLGGVDANCLTLTTIE